MSKSLTGVRVLLLEDEFLIAMDVEQLCRDNGAEHVTVMCTLDELDGSPEPLAFDVAIVDLMLGSVSTLDFAARLYDSGVPFIIASGHDGLEEIAGKFPGVTVVGKPYGGEELVSAVVAAVANAGSKASDPA